MADTTPSPVDLAQLHQAIYAAFHQQYAAWTIASYSQPVAQTTLPGVYFKLTTINPSTPADSGTSQWSCVLAFSAYIVTTATAAGQLDARVNALALAALINGSRFGCPVGPAILTAIAEDTAFVDTTQYSVMRIDWTHEALVGTSIWQPGTDPVPDQILVSISPRIGIPNVDYYQPVNTLP
ncbi:MAG: hypothetical protein ACFUZC_03460 [Chthoniobacteraceae bacterium]